MMVSSSTPIGASVAENRENFVNISIRPDRKLKKKVLVNGDFKLFPREGAKVVIELSDVVFVNSNGPCDVDDKCRYFKKDFMGNLEIGEADYYLDEALEQCLHMISRGEKSKIIMEYLDGKGQLGMQVVCVVKLLSTSDELTIGDWDWTRLHEHAEKQNNRGVALVKDKRIVDAFRRFSRGYKMITSVEPYDPEKIPPEKIQDLIAFKVKLLVNLAHCQLHNNQLHETVDLCNKAIDMDEFNGKALYRRGSARIGLQEWEAAYNDISSVLQMEPNNRDALAKMEIIKPKYKTIMHNYNIVIKKMFA